jgi:hypothetical protein
MKPSVWLWRKTGMDFFVPALRKILGHGFANKIGANIVACIDFAH